MLPLNYVTQYDTIRLIIRLRLSIGILTICQETGEEIRVGHLAGREEKVVKEHNRIPINKIEWFILLFYN